MIPNAPQRGFPVTADWGRSVVDAIRRLRLRAGPGIKITQTPEGTTVTATQPPEGMAVAAAVEWPQWQCSLSANRDGDPALFVGSGNLAWGGGHNATWQGRQIALDMQAGSKRFLMWRTKSAPIPHEACLAGVPTGPVCVDVKARDPGAFSADVGAVGLYDNAARQTGWTDAHLLAIIERTESGFYNIEQVQVAEIAVHAVVYPGETPEAPTPEEAAPATCAGGGTLENFPSGIDKTTIPWTDHDVSWGDGGTTDFPSKVAACW